MSDSQHIERTRARPWWTRDAAVDEFRAAIENGTAETPKMKRTLTIVRAIVVNLGIIALSFYGLRLGGSVTIITVFALGVLAAYNGIEASELRAFFQAFQEAKQNESD
jgi:hypothetical protein